MDALKRKISLSILCAFALVGGFVTCTTAGPVVPAEDPVVVDIAPPQPEPPPYIPPPEMSAESWSMPDYGRFDPPFPYFPDEDTTSSRSVGDVVSGHLINSQPLPLPHPHMAILPRQYQRHLHYTSDSMIALLEDAVAHVAEEFPDSVLYLGNFGRQGGGNIPHSVSHNNGRDADLAFYVVDEDGEPAHKPDLLRFDENGRFVGADLEETNFPDLVLVFDAARNWRLVEGLIESDAAHIQYIFVSNPLRRMLLEEGRRQNASAQTLRIARSVLVQPGDALPHDDHFHLRLHCSALDKASGCVERGRPGPTYRADFRQFRQVLSQAEELLTDEHPYWRRNALLRLALFDDHGLDRRVVELLDDPDPGVRVAALRALQDHRFSDEALALRLDEEENPQVFAEVVATLARRGPGAVEPLTRALSRDFRIHFGSAASLSTTALVADALARLEDPAPVPHLIDLLPEVDEATRNQLIGALRILTNHSFAQLERVGDEDYVDQKVQAWIRWWEEHGQLDRDQWIALGFQRAGFDVDGIHRQAVWELCRAISAEPHLNFNAQRALMRLSGRNVASLGWHPHDASFYWRRYFEDRQDSLNIPPIPSELSTAAGYTPPPD